MPKPSVFTPEQQAFLKPYTEAFNLARTKRRKPQFREEVGKPFLEKWPELIPDDWEPRVDEPPPPPGTDTASLPPPPPPPPPSAEEQRRNFQTSLDTRRKNVNTNSACSKCATHRLTSKL